MSESRGKPDQDEARDLVHLHGRRLLLVASTGGHLAQLMRLREMVAADSHSLVYTFRTQQSTSLLRDTRAVMSQYVGPRDVRGIARATIELVDILRKERFDAVVSTGAGIAISAAVAAKLTRHRFTFIESVSRFTGPSSTGRLLGYFPGVDRYTQHPAWATDKWRLTHRLLQPQRRNAPSDRPIVDRPLRIFVSLGTIRPYRFDALVDGVLRSSRPEDRITWQLGATMRADLPGQVFDEMPAASFNEALATCDVFVTHAGVGTVMQALAANVVPVVSPRRASRREHVDDHQMQVARMLREEERAVVSDAASLERSHFLLAAAR